MIETIAAFAATLASPFAAILVIAAAFGLKDPRGVRLAAGATGLLLELPEFAEEIGLLRFTAGALASVAACLLQAELCLTFLVPAWRLGAAIASHLGLRLRLLLRGLRW